ncbi:hypothetical protein GH714_040182 [Hevea brasiliensis]|uniref:Uncharacterized protein n=1 Tax=Hevea brasiliensis TaxID=3981 RepID=A0A6A6MPT1_HEVBR|nr:hypothetical protein GH714_040182 [Hevea brasiliensis]
MSLAAQSLVSLHLQNNNLQGKILMSLRHLESLETLDLSMNAFDGFIPSWIGENLSSLKILSLHSNKFEGEIPLQLCFLASLHILNLANNMMIGTIPTCFGNFTAIIMHEDKGLWDYHTSENPYVHYDKDSYGENVQDSSLLETAANGEKILNKTQVKRAPDHIKRTAHIYGDSEMSCAEHVATCIYS